MTFEEIMEKNLTLSFEFSLYVTQHPEFASQIPPHSRVVLLPGDDQGHLGDPELAKINRETAEKARQLVQPHDNGAKSTKRKKSNHHLQDHVDALPDDTPNRPVVYIKFERLLPACSQLARPRLVTSSRVASRA